MQILSPNLVSAHASVLRTKAEDEGAKGKGSEGAINCGSSRGTVTGYRVDVCEIVAATILTLPHRHLMSHENLVSSAVTEIIGNVACLFKIISGKIITADLQGTFG